jgi:hypothetical protein
MACSDEKHQEHICSLTARGEVELIHTLALKPTFECGICSAKVNDQDRVCDPVALPDIAWMGDGADVPNTYRK